MTAAEKNIRSRTLQVLRKKYYGKYDVENDEGEILVHAAEPQQGRIIYHLPDSLVIQTDNPERICMHVAGFDLPAIAESISPTASKNFNFHISFCRNIYRQYITADTEILNVWLCNPSEAHYMLLCIGERLHPIDYKLDDTFWHSCSTRYLEDDELIFTDFWLVEMGYHNQGNDPQSDAALQHYAQQYRQAAAAYLNNQDPTPIIPFQESVYQDTVASSLQDEVNKVKAEVDTELNSAQTARAKRLARNLSPQLSGNPLTLQSFHFLDAMSGEQAFVIAPDGRLIKPDQAEDFTDVYEGNMAQLETWSYIPEDYLVLHWRLRDFESGHECSILHVRFGQTTIAQSRRANFIGRTIGEHWKKCAQASQIAFAIDIDKCQWPLADIVAGEGQIITC